MRARPLIWVTLGVICLVAILAYMRLAHRPGSAPVSPETSTATAPRAPRVAKTNAYTVADATAPAAMAGREKKAAAQSDPLAHRFSNTPRTAGQLLRDDRAILLENALIDTSQPLGFSVPAHLQAASDPGSYIVQARGAVDNTFRSALAAAGATIVSYIPNNAYLVRASAESAAQLKGNPQTQAVLPYEPVYKLKGDLLRLGLTEEALPREARLNVMAFADGRSELAAELEQRGLTVVAETGSPFGPVFTVQVPEGTDWTSLARLASVELIEVVSARVQANDLSRVRLGVAADTQTETNHLQLTGTNVLVVMNDGGVSADHPDLVNRVIPAVPGLDVDDDGHGTHVAGIIMGNGTQSLTVTNAAGSLNPATNFQYRGMAPNANLYVQSWSDSDRALQEGAALTNALISNNSWNYDVSSYNIAASSYDAAVRDSLSGVTGSQPVLFVFSAGNTGNSDDDGLTGDADSILSPATAKNVLTVGAIELQRNITNQTWRCTPCLSCTNGVDCVTNQPWLGMTGPGPENQVASFSSRGNVGRGIEGDFGRFKPDVVAPGTFVVSTRPTTPTWEQAYYNPTSHFFATFEAEVFTNFLDYHEIFIPVNAVGFRIQLLPHEESPIPFPDLPIYVRRADYPIVNPPQFDFVRTNSVSVPPDGGGLGGNVGQLWYYGIRNTTSNNLRLQIVHEVIVTNEFGNRFEVLSNLNNSLSGGGPHYYRYESGTSMAAAGASGTLALMQEFFQEHSQPRLRNSPALMKALLINGARSVSENYFFEVLNTVNHQGWGLLKLRNSVPAALTNGINTASSAMYLFDQSPTNALATGQSQTYAITLSEAARTQPLRVTLVWTDPPGNPAAGVKLVNDLDLVVTSLDDPTRPIIYHGNDIPAGSVFTFAASTNDAAIIDAVNNVENVYISPALGSNYSITITANRVNVNAVTAHPNNFVQDYALVISSGDGQVTNAITLGATTPVVTSGVPPVTPITNLFNAPTFSSASLEGQRVGANTPLLGDTNGTRAQWHFFVVTNTTQFTNASFLVSASTDLAVPRAGVFETRPADATRRFADVDLYVTTDPAILQLDATAVAGANKSLSRNTVNGDEAVIYDDSVFGRVYYIGVKSEDYQAAEFELFTIFSLLPLGNEDEFGFIQAYPVNTDGTIPEGPPEAPGIARFIAFVTTGGETRRVVVTNTITHEAFSELVGSMTSPNGIAVALNNHRETPLVPAPPGPYQFLYEDNDEGDFPNAIHPDGPGQLRDYVGDARNGQWKFYFVDDALTSRTGRVDALKIRVDRQPNNGVSVTNTIPPLAWQYYAVNVPVGATNLTVCVGVISPNPQPLQVFVRKDEFPTPTAYDYTMTVTTPYPGDCLVITPADLPPLTPGRYFVGVFNPSSESQTYVYTATYYLGPAVVPINWGGSGSQPIVDDAVDNYTQFVTNNARIAQVEVGLRIDHPRVSDLAVTLISPEGTRVLLVENRGGTDSSGFGSSMYLTNFVPVSASGSNQPHTTVIETGTTMGTLTINYNFETVPDQMTVYYDGAPLWDSGMISGVGQQTLTYGPGSGTQVTIIVNEFGNTNLTTAWSYTVSSTSASHSYLTFTENTNLLGVMPVKFALPPFLPTNAPAPVGISDFELPTTSGHYFGPATGVPDGWNVITTDPVTVLSNPPAANTGAQSLALRSGEILRSIATVPQQTYRLNYAYRQVPNLDGIVGWWPGQLTGADVVGGNTAVLNNGATYTNAEAGIGFSLDGVDDRIIAAATPALDFGPGVDFSIEAWIQGFPPLTPRSFGVITLVDKRFAPNNSECVGIGLNLQDGRLALQMSDGPAANAAWNYYVSSGPNLNDGQLHHIAATVQRNSTTGGRLYVDGQVVLTFDPTLESGDLSTTAPLRIGNHDNQSLSCYFRGAIDDLAIYRRALTTSEVQSIYVAGASGKFGLTMPPDDALVSPNYPFHRSPVGAQIYVPGQVTNSFLGDSNWQSGGLFFRATSNSTLIGLAPAVRGNHYYQFIRTNISWQDARALAATLSTNSLVVSHLATITSAAENEFIRQTFGTNLVSEFAWIGGREPLNNGVWRWDVGPEANLPISLNATPLPPFNYANWGVGQPPGGRPTADYLMFNIGTPFGNVANGQWAAAAPTNSPLDPVVGFLVEFEPIPPVQSGVMVDSFFLQQAAQPRYVLPESSLDILRGENAYGLWQLEIWDARTGATNQVSLVDWQLQFVFITNTPTARGLQPCAPFRTSIPPGQIAYYSVDVPTFARFGTNFLFNASGPLNFYFNQTMPPTFGATNIGDVVFGTNVTTVTRVLSTNGVPPLLPGQRYYLAIENQGVSNVNYTLQVCFDLSSIPSATRLTNAVSACATNFTPLSIDYYLFTVSTNAKRAQFEINNPSGDMTLLVRRSLPPTFGVFDYFSANPFTNDELVTVFDFNSPVPLTPGDWYLGAANLANGPVTYCIKATEWIEYGTNIVVTNVVMSSNSFCLTWTSLPGVKYYVEGITNVTSTNWVPASPTITATGYSTTYCIPLPTPLQFFRVREGLAIDPFAPPPVITRIEEVLTGFLISWSGPANAQYNVQWTSSLNTPPPIVWTTFLNPPTVTSTTGLFQFLDDGSETGGFGATRFYRLILLP